VHAARRARLADSFLGDRGSVFLAPSADGFSGGETFRQLDDFLYFTGLELPNSVLAIETESGTCTIFVPERDARFESASRPNDFPGRPLQTDADLASAAGVDVLRPYSELDDALGKWVAEGRVLLLNPGRADSVAVPASDYVRTYDAVQVLRLHLATRHPEAHLESAFPAIASLRMVKGPEEVERIADACAITVDALHIAARHVRPGVDERTLEAELEAAFKRGGAQRPAFDSIIKSGPNSLWPWRILASHYDRRNRRMQAGELVIFDVGCELDHYASDIGRTFPVSGRFTPEQAELVRTVTRASDAVMAATRPGITFAELREVALEAIPVDRRRYLQTGLFFGHHIGLDVGDASLGEVPLAPGMVFTIEPWYYDHDREVAVFIEDDVVVTEDGVRNLSAALPRTPEALERMLR
jgi:Xaa-Pro aminopeptidase